MSLLGPSNDIASVVDDIGRNRDTAYAPADQFFDQFGVITGSLSADGAGDAAAFGGSN